jgi:hypothetical protein
MGDSIFLDVIPYDDDGSNREKDFSSHRPQRHVLKKILRNIVNPWQSEIEIF